MACDVIGVGTNSVDTVCVLPVCPGPDAARSKLRISRQFTSCGGQTTTALATCARMGRRTAYVGTTGSDENGRAMREALAERGIDTTHAVVRDAPNGFAIILLDSSTGERIVLWDRDERLMLRPDEVPAGAIASARVLHVDDVDQDAAIRAASIARNAGLIVTSDIDRLTPLTRDLIAAVTIPMFAEGVPLQLTGTDDVETALRSLRRDHPGLLVVTLGAAGAAALEGDRFCQVPGFRVRTIDTTGAGDVFRGGFIHGLLEGWPVERMLRVANAAAAVSCTRLGAMNGACTLAEVETMTGRIGD